MRAHLLRMGVDSLRSAYRRWSIKHPDEFLALRDAVHAMRLHFHTANWSMFERAVGELRTVLLLPFARHGDRMMKGRKEGTVGPIRKRIRALLRGDPERENLELWERIKDRPPKGCEFIERDARAKWYIDGPKAADRMTWRSFCNACWKERQLLK